VTFGSVWERLLQLHTMGSLINVVATWAFVCLSISSPVFYMTTVTYTSTYMLHQLDVL